MVIGARAYVIGLALVAAGFSSSQLFSRSAPDGSCQLYYLQPFRRRRRSAARKRAAFSRRPVLCCWWRISLSRQLSGWAAVSYLAFQRARPTCYRWSDFCRVINSVLAIGQRFALPAVPAVLVVILIAISSPHLRMAELEPAHSNFVVTWVQFVGVILALSGVEAVANITGVMKLDPGSSPEHPKVTQTATKAIVPVAIEVVFGTALLGWAMLSLPKFFAPQLTDHKEDMLRFLAEHYGAVAIAPWFGTAFGIMVGIIFGLLLFSAVNTAVVALIGVVFMMAQDGEMPRQLARLNRHGVPKLPLIAGVAFPIIVLALTEDFNALAGLYAVGVVGAIAVNLGSCSFNRELSLGWFQRFIMVSTFLVLFAVEVTIAKTKPDALFFACTVLGIGLTLRFYSHKLSGLTTLTVTRKIGRWVPDLARRHNRD